MIDRSTLLALVPHQLGMCLLDGVHAWDEASLHAFSDSHRRADNPLRRADRLNALHLCEYGAQAMAVHGGLRARVSGGLARPGLLVALRAVELHVARIDELPGALECSADMLADGDTGWQYAFRIRHGEATLAEGRAAVMLQVAQDDPPAIAG